MPKFVLAEDNAQMKEMSRCEQNLVSSILIFAGNAPCLIGAQSCRKVAEVSALEHPAIGRDHVGRSTLMSVMSQHGQIDGQLSH
jgi:hypothetical protein